MFGGHQRSLHKYPKPEPTRPANALKQYPSDTGLALHVDCQERDRLTQNRMASSSQGQLADFGGWPSTDPTRPRSAASHKTGHTVRLDDPSAPPLPGVFDKRLPDLSQRLIHIPMRTSSSQNNTHRSNGALPPSPPSPNMGQSRSGSVSSVETYETKATSMLPALQTQGPPDDGDTMEPLLEDDPRSFNLVAPGDKRANAFSLETRSDQLFSRRHLEIIFADPGLLLRFTTFLGTHRPRSIPVLVYHLDSLKALRAIRYANAVADSLDPIDDLPFTTSSTAPTANTVLEEKSSKAFDVLAREDLPAYITHLYTQVVTTSITRRITGTLPSHLREASEGLAEVFCLTDPSRPDNPIVFASEEFHRTTQYGMSYVIGRNCRFLQGPRTNPFSVDRFRKACVAGKEACEVFLNYRRDGSPFMNLLMIAPLTDSRGQIRYFIGAQVDVSGIVKDCTDLESLRRLVEEDDEKASRSSPDTYQDREPKKPELQELSEVLNLHELDTVRRHGGWLHRDPSEDESDTASGNWQRPRLMLAEPSPDEDHKNYKIAVPQSYQLPAQTAQLSGKLSGVYQNYLLVRPYPSLRILFASPTLRVPGILQSPFMKKIGGSPRVREELTQALAEGRGVTARVRWLSKVDEDGRNRWIHCTPLLGSNQQIGVWMIVLVDEEKEHTRRYREAPPVNPNFRRAPNPNAHREINLSVHSDSTGHTSPINPQLAKVGYQSRLDSLNPPPSPTETDRSVLSVRL